jgi:hypothetical protein
MPPKPRYEVDDRATSSSSFYESRRAKEHQKATLCAAH